MLEPAGARRGRGGRACREIYRVGGAQAVAALAYGTATIPPVDRIVGPGNAYVAEAKRQVFGRVGIDSIAGPSEVVILADGAQDPRHVAIDLLAQAEHDESAQSILITDDPALADAVADAVEAELRHPAARRHRRRELARPWLHHPGPRLGRGGRAGQRARARAPADHGRRPAAPVRADPARRRRLPRRGLPGGGRRLCGRAQPRAADRPHRPFRLRPVGVRLPQAHHLGRGATGPRCARSARPRWRWPRPKA